MVPETDGVKLMKGFTIQLGGKGTDMEQMSMRTSHLRIDWLIKNRHIGGHTIFNKRDTPQNTASPK